MLPPPFVIFKTVAFFRYDARQNTWTELSVELSAKMAYCSAMFVDNICATTATTTDDEK